MPLRGSGAGFPSKRARVRILSGLRWRGPRDARPAISDAQPTILRSGRPEPSTDRASMPAASNSGASRRIKPAMSMKRSEQTQLQQRLADASARQHLRPQRCQRHHDALFHRDQRLVRRRAQQQWGVGGDPAHVDHGRQSFSAATTPEVEQRCRTPSRCHGPRGESRHAERRREVPPRRRPRRCRVGNTTATGWSSRTRRAQQLTALAPIGGQAMLIPAGYLQRAGRG